MKTYAVKRLFVLHTHSKSSPTLPYLGTKASHAVVSRLALSTYKGR
jgi:hypothetical protein